MRGYHKSIHILAVASFLFVFGLAALWANGKQEAATSKTVTLNFPHWFFANGGNFGDWINGAVDAFEHQHPNIKVNREKAAYAQYWNKIDTEIAAGNPPDVAAFWSANLGKYIDAGALLPLNGLINMADVEKNFSPLQTKDIPAMAPNGKTYGLVFDSGFYLPMYRPSVLKAAGISQYPTTPQGFVNMVSQLSKGGNYGYAFMDVAGDWEEEVIDLYIWTIGFGGNWTNSSGKPTLNSQPVIEAITYLKKMFDAGYVPKDTKKATYQKMFGAGKVGTLIDGMWMYGLLLPDNPSLKGDFKTAPLPFPTQRVAAFFENDSVMKGTKHPKEAAELVSFLSNEQQQTRLVEIIGNIPGRNVFTSSVKQKLLNKWPWYGEFIDHIPDMVNMVPDKMPGKVAVQVEKIWATYFEKVLFNNMSVTDAMNAAEAQALKVYNAQ